MPTISIFYGIYVRMYFNDHPPPHFHARYGKHHVKIDIETGAILAGSLPRRALAHVQEWRDLHRTELMACWQRALAQQPPGRVEPLE